MPVARKFHRILAFRIAPQRGQHTIHDLQRMGPVAGNPEPVLRHRSRDVPLSSERRNKRPDLRLHHQFRNVPKGLHLDGACTIHPKELVRKWLVNVPT